MRVLVVDDHALIREAMVSILREIRPGAEIETAADVRSMYEILDKGAVFELLLLDLNLPDGHGLPLLEGVIQRYPALPIAVLSAERDPSVMRRTIEVGAQGYIAKTEPRDLLIRAIELILAHGVYVPLAALGPTLKPSGPTEDDVPRVATPSPVSLGLTDRQVEVLALLMQGKSNKHICRDLSLAEPTVKNHISAILRALNVNSRTEAVLAVTKYGWSLGKP
ncbi:MAG: response regulator transcription factor [Beijerinckiaceae bacterium]|nr:response regulator transcription factor [Beijerinckiaceae bacterium]MCZ8299459.1 response regulator transcription factor [Beijerinckiaceae bacterium]